MARNGPRHPPTLAPVREGVGGGFQSKTGDIKVITVYRLDKEVYDILEKQLGHIQVGSSSNVHDVAYQLGIQKVLQELRKGIVIES